MRFLSASTSVFFFVRLTFAFYSRSVRFCTGARSKRNVAICNFGVLAKRYNNIGLAAPNLTHGAP